MVKSHLLNKLSYSQFLGQLKVLSNAASPLTLPVTRLFGKDGIRGRVGAKEVLNPMLAVRIGFWVGQILQTLSRVITKTISG